MKPRTKRKVYKNALFQFTAHSTTITDQSDIAEAFDGPGVAEAAVETIRQRLDYIRKLFGMGADEDPITAARRLCSNAAPLTARHEGGQVLEYGTRLNDLIERPGTHPAAAAFYAMHFEAAVHRLALIPAAEVTAAGMAFRQEQRRKAQLPRAGVIAHIADDFAGRVDELGDPIRARELWGHVFSELEHRGHRPAEVHDEAIAYEDHRGHDKTVTLKTWRDSLSKARRRL